MINIVTQISIDNEDADDVSYPMLYDFVKDKRVIYWRCALTFFLTSLNVNIDQRHIIYTNDDKDIIIDGIDIKQKLTSLGVEVVILPFNRFDPGVHSKRYRNAFYKFEVMQAMSKLKNSSVMVDADCVWSRRDDDLIALLESGNKILLTDTYQKGVAPYDRAPDGLSMSDFGKLYKTISLPYKTKDYSIWYGGEFIGASASHYKMLIDKIEEIYDYCIKKADSGGEITFSDGQSVFENEEYVSSYVFNLLPESLILDCNKVYIKRIWTTSGRTNLAEDDIKLPIWHMAGEKLFGLHLLFDELAKNDSDFYLDQTNIPEFLAPFFRILEPDEEMGRKFNERYSFLTASFG